MRNISLRRASLYVVGGSLCFSLYAQESQPVSAPSSAPSSMAASQPASMSSMPASTPSQPIVASRPSNAPPEELLPVETTVRDVPSNSTPGPLSIGLQFGVILPQITTELRPTGGGELELGYRLAPSKERLMLFVNGGYTRPKIERVSLSDPRILDTNGNPVAFDGTQKQQELTLGAGLLVRFLPSTSVFNVYGAASLRSYFLHTFTEGAAASEFGLNEETSVQLGGAFAGGAEYQVGPGAIHLDLLFGTSNLPHLITGDVSTGALLGAVGYRFFLGNPRDPGAALLGEEGDLCKGASEDLDGFEDTDGCPELDNDKDNVADVVDQCPLESEDVDGFEDDNGCPELDNDKDNIVDESDMCPVVAGSIFARGCPDADNDTIVDTDDKCVNEVEDLDGFEDDNGCPELDNDQDGVLDTRDNCPLQPMLQGPGPGEARGCPDDLKDPLLAYSLTFDAKKATIKKDDPTVAALIAFMNQYPERTLIIEGHADDPGNDTANQKLSEKRAEAIKNALIKAKIDKTRIETKGAGKTMPLDTLDTPEAHAANRRVTFSQPFTSTTQPTPQPMSHPATAPATQPTP